MNHYYIACLDMDDKLQIKRISGVRSKDDKTLIMDEKLTGIRPISKMHWDSVCKAVGKKTISTRAIGDNWARGYVFYHRIDALKRLENYVENLESIAMKQMEQVASHRARLDIMAEENRCQL